MEQLQAVENFLYQLLEEANSARQVNPTTPSEYVKKLVVAELDTPPLPVEKTRFGVATLRLAVVIDARRALESTEVFLGAVEKSTVEQLSPVE